MDLLVVCEETFKKKLHWDYLLLAKLNYIICCAA
jgi:hypothetical protein